MKRHRSKKAAAAAMAMVPENVRGKLPTISRKPNAAGGTDATDGNGQGRRNDDVPRLPAGLLSVDWPTGWRGPMLVYPFKGNAKPVRTKFGRALAAVPWLEAIVDRQEEIPAAEWSDVRERLVVDTLAGCAASLALLELVAPRLAGWARFEAIRRRVYAEWQADHPGETPPAADHVEPEPRPAKWR